MSKTDDGDLFDVAGLESYIMVEDLENGGVWFDFPGNRSFRLKRVSPGNRGYSRRLKALTSPYKSPNGIVRDISAEESARIMGHVCAYEVMTDWSGIHNRSGESIPFTPGMAEKFLKRVPELLNELLALAGDATRFSEAQLQEAKDRLGER